MASDHQAAFAALRPLLAKYADRLSVQTDAANAYALTAKFASPFKQHKGRPLEFASVHNGKAYVSVHLMPVYMHPGLLASIPADLKERMQGKSCFNFKNPPEPQTFAALARLIEDAFNDWSARKWV
jgi:hypothetical protein